MKPLAMNAALALVLLIALEFGARWYLHLEPAPSGSVPGWTISNTLDRPPVERAPLQEASLPLPLAGLSHCLTRLCQEDGPAVSYVSDRYGFNNDDATWDKPVDTVLIGDSFVQGYCITKDKQLATALVHARRAAGQEAGTVLNLGLKGSGPFSQLGVLREYVLSHATLKTTPRRIYWFILANDLLYDLDRESVEEPLVRYLGASTQGLATRQADVDRALALLGAAKPREPSAWTIHFPDAILRAITRAFRPEPFRGVEGELSSVEVSSTQLELFASILAAARRLAHENEIAIDFVFIPDSWSFTKAHGPRLHALIERLTATLDAKGIALWNPVSFFETGGSPTDPLIKHRFNRFAVLDGYYGHYTAEGYRRLAEFLTANENQKQLKTPQQER